MIEILLVILVILWPTGNLSIPGLVIPDFGLFSVNGNFITLWDIIIFILVLWIIGLLPSPFRQIAGVLLVLWVLSVFGIFAFVGSGIANILMLFIIIGIIASFFRGTRL